MMRVRAEPLFGFIHADLVQKLNDARARALARQAAVQLEAFSDVALYRVQWIERRRRFLKNHRHAVAAQATQGPFRGAD